VKRRGRFARCWRWIPLWLLQACAETPEAKLAKELDACISSVSMVQATLAHWLRNSVPDAFAQRALEEQHKQLSDAEQSMSSIAAPEPLKSESMKAARASEALSQNAAVTGRDSASAKRQQQSIDSILIALRALKSQAQAQGSQ
jgi:hypothetical protein